MGNNYLKNKFRRKYLKFRPYNRGKLLNSILDFIFEYLFPNEDEEFIKNDFYRRLKYPLNVNNPKTFNEKLQWLKLNDRTKLHTICADKYLVREYIEKKIGANYLIPLVFSTKNSSEINEKNLPDYPVIVKTNHDSGTALIIKNKNNYDWKKTQEILKKAMSFNYYFNLKEWQYKNIEPRIIVEQLLLDNKGSIPKDYKFQCLNGKVYFISVDVVLEKEKNRNFYDSSWNELELEYFYKKGPKQDKPELLNKMIELAEKLAKPFHCVRVDFYFINSKIYFGELTFHPGGGTDKFSPESWDLKIGKQLVLPE